MALDPISALNARLATDEQTMAALQVRLTADELQLQALIGTTALPGVVLSLSPSAIASTALSLTFLQPTAGGVINVGGYQTQYRVHGTGPFTNGPAASVITPRFGTIIDSASTSWTISSNNVLFMNGAADPTTSNVKQFVLVNNQAWWQNQSGNWFGQAVPAIAQMWSAAVTTAPFTLPGVRISGLTPSTAYDFQVFATNALGTGPVASLSNVSTTAAAGVVPGAPTSLVATALSTTSVAITFTPPSTGGPLDNGIFRVQSRLHSGGTFADIAVASYITPGSGTITDAFGHVWAVTSTGHISIDGVIDTIANDVVMLVITGGVVYIQNNVLNLWYHQSLPATLGVWSAGVATSPFTSPGILVPGLVANTSYDFQMYVRNTAGIGTLSSVIQGQGSTGVIGDPTGIQAIRAADFISTFGTNIYPLNGQDGGSPSELAGQFTYLMGGTGHRLIARVYTHPNGGAAMQAVVQPLITSNKILIDICTDSYLNSDMSGAVQLCQLLAPGDIAFVEGLNEPNSSGFGPFDQATIMAGQVSLYNTAHALGLKVAGPSVLFNCADQVTFWNATGQLSQLLANCDYISSHLYPGWGCFNGVNMLHDWTDTTSLGNKPVVITECDYALYNTQLNGYPQLHTVDATGYMNLCAWTLGYAQHNVRGFVHWSMNDFTNEGFFPVGLFANSAATPHRWATQIAAFIKLLTDNGATARTFQPGKLDITPSNLPAGSGGSTGGSIPLVLQTSNGDFYAILQNEQNAFSGATSTVGLTFGTNCTLFEDYSITNADGSQNSKTPSPRTPQTNITSATSVLGTEFRVLHIRKI